MAEETRKPNGGGWAAAWPGMPPETRCLPFAVEGGAAARPPPARNRDAALGILRALLAEKLFDLSHQVRRRRQLVLRHSRRSQGLLVFVVGALALELADVISDLLVLRHDVVEVLLELHGGLAQVREIQLYIEQAEHPTHQRHGRLGVTDP